MRTLSFPYSPVILAALIAAVSLKPLLADEPEVVDPTTGETVSISDIDIAALSDEDRVSIGDQLAEQGFSSRGRGRADLSGVEVVDPTSGETVTLGDIDRSSLSDEDRENIGDQLAEQGISAGRGGQDADTGTEADTDTDTDTDAEADADTSASADSDNGRGGRGGEGRGGRGGPRD